MFTELLSQCIQEAGVEYAHLEPPCPEEEIAQAEAAVGYPFPEELKALLRETNGDHWFCGLQERSWRMPSCFLAFWTAATPSRNTWKR